MNRRIIGVTVGTPTSPSKIEEEIKPISYGQQDLTEEQKASARQNIGAAPNRVFVKADEVQELTHKQMDTARYNINAASVEDVTKRTEYDGFVDEDVTSTLTIEADCYYGKNLMKLEQKGLACTSLIPVKSGDKFKISSVYGYYSPLIAEFDSTKTMVSYTAQIDGTDVPVTDYEYTVPSGISYIAINSRYQQTKPLVVKKVVVDSVKHRIAKLEKGGTGGGTGEIPDKLPNPHKLTFTGAVNAEYDGSKEVEVEIPTGGGGAEWNLVADIIVAEDVAQINVENEIANHGYTEIVVFYKFLGLGEGNYTSRFGDLKVWFGGGNGGFDITFSQAANGTDSGGGTLYAICPQHDKNSDNYFGIAFHSSGNKHFRAPRGIQSVILRPAAGIKAGSFITIYGR